jgi:hypothetical protein
MHRPWSTHYMKPVRVSSVSATSEPYSSIRRDETRRDRFIELWKTIASSTDIAVWPAAVPDVAMLAGLVSLKRAFRCR